jgi:hypothetical protein
VAPRNRTGRSTDADSATVMEGSPTVEKLQGMSLRDQDEREMDTSSGPTPDSEVRDLIPLLSQSDGSESDGEGATAAASSSASVQARPASRPLPLPTAESAAIAAKRAQLQAALRDRPRWMARPVPSSPPVGNPGQPLDTSPPADLVAAAPAPSPELPEETPKATISPYSPPDWKTVFGDHEEAAADHSSEKEREDEAAPKEPSDPAEVEAAPEPNLPRSSDDAAAESDSEPGYFDLSYEDQESEAAAPERSEDEVQSFGEDEEPQHVFVEPPSLLDSPAAQEARRRFRAAYELYRSPHYAAGRVEDAPEHAPDQHEPLPAYSADQDHQDYFDPYDEVEPPPASAEQRHYDHPPIVQLPNPPSEALRRAATVASSRFGAPVRVPARRPQPFEGASSNMREALDSLNARGRVVRPESVRRAVASQRRSSRSMSGAAVAAALMMSACGGLGIYAWKAGGLDAVMAMIPAAASSDHSLQALPAPHQAAARPAASAAAPPPKVADDDTDQQTEQPDNGPVVIEATTTSEGPTGALPEAAKEEAPPAEHSPPPLAEAPPVPEPPPAAAEASPPPAAAEAAPPPAAAAKDQGKAPSRTAGKATKKRFHTARLSVSDVEGVEQQYVPLNLTMDTGEGANDIQLRLSGLPEAAKLSAGQKLADGAWVVTAKEAAGLSVLTPDIDKPERHTVAVEAVEAKTGSLAAPTQEMQLSIVPRKVIVEPAAAPADDNPAHSQGGKSQAVIELPPAQPAAVPPPDADATAAIDKPAADEKAAEPAAKPGKLPKLASLNAEPEAAPAKPAPAKPAPAAAAEPAAKPGKLPKVASLNAEPDAVPAKPAAAQAAEPAATDDDLIARGDELLSLGDIVAARQLYEFAFDRGQMQAAVALGRTYDPVTFEKLKVRGLSPNPQLALEWYEKAEKAGIKGAQADIEALSAWLAR